MPAILISWLSRSYGRHGIIHPSSGKRIECMPVAAGGKTVEYISHRSGGQFNRRRSVVDLSEERTKRKAGTAKGVRPQQAIRTLDKDGGTKTAD